MIPDSVQLFNSTDNADACKGAPEDVWEGFPLSVTGCSMSPSSGGQLSNVTLSEKVSGGFS